MILNMVFFCCFFIVSDIDCYLKNFMKFYGIFYDIYLLLGNIYCRNKCL